MVIKYSKEIANRLKKEGYVLNKEKSATNATCYTNGINEFYYVAGRLHFDDSLSDYVRDLDYNYTEYVAGENGKLVKKV